MRSPSCTEVFAKSLVYRPSPQAGLTFKILVREVEEQNKDRATIICINDTSASINHELGGYNARVLDKHTQGSLTLTEPTPRRDASVCTKRNSEGKLGID